MKDKTKEKVNERRRMCFKGFTIRTNHNLKNIWLRSFCLQSFSRHENQLYKYTSTSMNYNEMSFVLTNYVKKEFFFKRSR